MPPNADTPTAAGPGERPLTIGSGIDFSDPNSPLAPFFLRTAHLVALGVIGFVFVISTQFTLWHTDVWGHLKYGRWMVDHRAIPDRELFCPWWDGRIPFTQFYTVSQSVMSEVYSAGERLAGGNDVRRMAGGVEMIRLLHAVLTTARFAVLAFVFVRATGSWTIAVVALAAVILLDLSNLAVFRPQTFGELLFAVLLLPLSRPELSRRAVILVPLLCAAWANTHGSYVVALVLLGTLLAGRVLDRILDGPRGWRVWTDPQSVRLAGVSAASVVAIGLLNPYGFEFFSRTLALTAHPSVQAGVVEWQPLAFAWAPGWHWVFMLSLLVVGLTQLAAARPIPPSHLILLILFGCAVALQVRFVIWWAMLVPWVLAPRWAEIAAARWPARWTPAESTPSFRKTAVAAAMLFAIVMWSGTAGWAVSGDPLPVEQAVSAGTPWRLARQIGRPDDPSAVWLEPLDTILKENYPDGRFVGTIMATPMQGDYLMWALAPDVPVTYSHMHLFHPDYWEELGRVGGGDPSWWDVLEKYRANLIVVEADYSQRLRAKLRESPEWAVVHDESGDAAKPDPMTRQLIAVRVHPL